MSKLKTLEVQSKDVKSITAEELSTLQQGVTSQNQAQIRLGGFEMQKIIYLDEAMKAAEAVDECVGKIADAVLARGGLLAITADHGNAEELQNLLQ